ncbi:MAG: YARHG domain-containing protein [Rhizobium sp.]|nr:YARHG domain-containing protein [Rhizobium sp.]
MRISTLAILTVVGAATWAQPAFADACYDLWYERNAIYNDNGYCFNTRDGRRTFDNSDCYTDYPDFSRREQRRINQIKREERRMGCT